MRKKLLFILFASLIFFGAVALMYPWFTPWSLTVYAPKEGEILDRLPLQSNATFTLKYIHSVTQREVAGTFTVTKDGKIKPQTTTFDTFGPGLPVLDGSLSYTQEDGAYIVLHEEEPRDKISLFVSPLTRERLVSADTELELSGYHQDPLLLHIFPEREFRYNKNESPVRVRSDAHGQD